MRSKQTAASLAGLVLLGVTACGGNAANKAQQASDEAQQQATAQVSPQGGQLLEQTQSLVASVARTGRDYANADITRQQAIAELRSDETRAKQLGDRATQLQSTSRARQGVQTLASEVARSSAMLRKRIRASGQGDRVDATQLLQGLRESADQAFGQVQDRLPDSTRQQIRQTLDRVKTLTG